MLLAIAFLSIIIVAAISLQHALFVPSEIAMKKLAMATHSRIRLREFNLGRAKKQLNRTSLLKKLKMTQPVTLRRVHQLDQTPICDLDWKQTPICVLNWLTNECDVCVLTLHSHFGFVFSILQ